MIGSKDRSWWFGASDTGFICKSWDTDTFAKWWQEKLGMNFKHRFSNKYTLAGTFYEHVILDTIPGIEKDKQITIPNLKLRINYDGNVAQHIYEVKTYMECREFKVTKDYWRQSQVEMYGMDSNTLDVLAYPLTEEHYKNYFIPIELRKRRFIPVDYDGGFIADIWLPRISYLCKCLEIGRWPREIEYEKHIKRKSKGLCNIRKG